MLLKLASMIRFISFLFHTLYEVIELSSELLSIFTPVSAPF